MSSTTPPEHVDELLQAVGPLELVEVLPTRVRVVDARGRCVFANAAWRALGSEGDPLQRVHPTDRPRVGAVLARTLAEGLRGDVLCRIQGPEGQWRWAREYVVPLERGGERIGAVVSTEDIDDPRQEVELVRAEAEAASEALQLLCQVSGAAVASLDSHDRFVRVTEGFAALHGLRREALVGRRLTDLESPLGATLLEAVAAARETGHTVQGFEAWDVRGQRCWTCAAHPGREQTVLSVVEITRAKRQEQALHLSEQRLRLAVAAAPLTLFHCDRRLRITWISRPMLGMKPDDILGLTPADLLGRSAEQLERLQRRVLRTGRGAHSEIVLEDSVGRERTWECWAEPHRQDDRVLGVMVVALDSTERKAAEAALRESEERFRGTFDNAGVGVAHMGADGRILRINFRFCRILGYEPQALIGRALHELVHPADWPQVERLEPPHGDARVRVYRRDGDVAWVTLTVSASGSTHSGEPYAIVVAQDITAQERAERQLKELTATLEVQVAKRTQRLERQAGVLQRLAAELTTTEQRERKRLAEMLHDHLQQYLVAARLKVGLAKRRASPDVQEHLSDADAMLHEAVKSARTLTAELRPPVLYEDGLIAALRWLVRRVHDQHGLEVDLTADPSAEPAQEHVRALLYTAVQELLLNVVKHAGVSQAEVRVARCGDELHVVVADAGAGFEPRAAEPPTGFGLVSVRERVTALEGRMEVSAAPGRGTEVHMYVPLDPRVRESRFDEDQTLDQPPRLQVAAGRGRVRVLLVDDHKIVREGLATLLEEQPNIEVVAHAADGQDAVELTAVLQPDVVVMDVNMPRMNGIEATRVIAQRWPHITVVGLSVQDEAGTAESMVEAGARAYLSKGGDPARLIDTILSWDRLSTPSGVGP